MRGSFAVMLVVVLVSLVVAVGAGAEPAGEQARDSGIRLACRACGLADALGGRLQSTALSATRAVPMAATREVSLDDERLEISAVATIAPKTTGTGGAISYRVATNTSGTASIWADVGVLRWAGDTRVFVGASTNIPIGATLSKYGRAGAGMMDDGTAFLYSRVAVSF